jgi:plasmid replication initiation protein
MIGINWCEYLGYDSEKRQAWMGFSPAIMSYFQNFENHYANIVFKDMGKLKSEYAARIYQLAASWKSDRGKAGNPSDSWKVGRKPIKVDEFREMFDMPKDKYKAKNLFIRYCVTQPIEEINRSIDEFNIECKKVLKGKQSIDALQLTAHMNSQPKRRTSPKSTT